MNRFLINWNGHAEDDFERARSQHQPDTGTGQDTDRDSQDDFHQRISRSAEPSAIRRLLRSDW